MARGRQCADADFAATTAYKRSRGRDSSLAARRDVEGVQIGIGTVTAVCQAWVSGDLFVGFDNGTVLGFGPGRNQVVPVAENVHPVAALASTRKVQTVVALRQAGSGIVMSCCLETTRRLISVASR